MAKRSTELVFNNNNVWFTYLGRKDGKTVRASCKERVQHPTATERKAAKKRAEATAVQLRAAFAQAKHAGFVPATPDMPTLAAFLPRWEAEWGRLQRGYDGRINYRLQSLGKVFGHLPLSAITPDVVHTWRVGRLAAGTAPRTVNRDVDLLKSVLAKGVPVYYPESPLRLMPRLKAAPAVIPTLTRDDEEKLLAEMDAEDKAIFLVALDALVRLGDVLALRWADVNVDDRTARVNESKTGRTYHVPLSSRAVEAVVELLPSPVIGTDYVFQNAGGTSKQATNSYTQRLKRVCERLGIRYGRKQGGITFHAATRHTGATRMAAAGVDLRTIQEVGGWANINMLQKYVHPASQALRDAVEKVGGEK